MKKYYGAPLGDYILYVFGPLFVSMFALVVLSANNIAINVEIKYFFSILLFIWMLIFIRRISYRLTIEGNFILEKGFFLPHRKINIFDITRIVRGCSELYIGAGKLSQRKVYFTVNGVNDFPYLPVTLNIIDQIVTINPNIKIAKNMADLLPRRLRNKFGLKLTTGEAVMRVLISILLLFVVFSILLVIIIL